MKIMLYVVGIFYVYLNKTTENNADKDMVGL